MSTYTNEKWVSKTGAEFKYLSYIPEHCEGEKLPIVFFLHGAGERGDDVEAVATHGFFKYIKEGKDYPFICIAPQCPNDKYWGCFTESLLEFIDFNVTGLNADENRVYLTGLSMGGTGTWMLALAAADRFAAIAPVCGTGIYWYGGELTNMPVFAWHGDCDTVVPPFESLNMVSSINQKGGNAQLKIVHGRGHDVWNDAYSGDELVTWLLSHKKENNDE